MQIKKLGYSVNPWRLVDDDGEECYMPVVFDHPDLGPTVIDEPVSAPTKRELVEIVLRLLSQASKKIRELSGKTKG